MTSHRRGGLLLVVTGLVTACAVLPAGQGLKPTKDGPAHVELHAVPFFPQQAYQCGPAALAMALAWSGLPTDPDSLVPEVYTPGRKGSLQTALIGAARRHGRVSYPVFGMDALLAELAVGHPVIVLQNLGPSWLPAWHYAVAIGYDVPQGMVLLRSGRSELKPLPFRLFDRTWAKAGYWGLLVLPPTELPATVQEEVYVEAVLGLEKARQWRAAATGYETASARWPGCLPALMGLGNSLYALGDLAGSERAFREASRLHPASGAAFNNLAQVLSEEGRRQEALEAARRAVALGGPLADVFRKTLEELEAKAP